MGHPQCILDLAPRDFPLFLALKEHLSGLSSLAMKASNVLPSRSWCYRNTFGAFGMKKLITCCVTGASTAKRTMLKNSIRVTNFIVFCHFLALKSYFWFMGTVTFWPTTIMVVLLSLLNC
jgi:hypothetical protein